MLSLIVSGVKKVALRVAKRKEKMLPLSNSLSACIVLYSMVLYSIYIKASGCVKLIVLFHLKLW